MCVSVIACVCEYVWVCVCMYVCVCVRVHLLIGCQGSVSVDWMLSLGVLYKKPAVAKGRRREEKRSEKKRKGNIKDWDKNEMGNVNVEREKFEVKETIGNTSQI